MGACLLVTGISSFRNGSCAASGCSSLHTTDQHIFFTSTTYDSQQNLFYDLLYTILGTAFGILVFLGMAIILCSLYPMVLDTALKISAAFVKMCSIHVDD